MAKKNRTEVEGVGELEIAGRDKETGEVTDTSALERAGVAFDPERMRLDLTKDEKRRTTALVLAIQAYDNLIIKDAEYLREAHSQARSNGSVIRPATMDAMVGAAINFDAFIAGMFSIQRGGIAGGSQSEAPVSNDEPPAAAETPNEPEK